MTHQGSGKNPSSPSLSKGNCMECKHTLTMYKTSISMTQVQRCSTKPEPTCVRPQLPPIFYCVHPITCMQVSPPVQQIVSCKAYSAPLTSQLYAPLTSQLYARRDSQLYNVNSMGDLGRRHLHLHPFSPHHRAHQVLGAGTRLICTFINLIQQNILYRNTRTSCLSEQSTHTPH